MNQFVTESLKTLKKITIFWFMFIKLQVNNIRVSIYAKTGYEI